MADFNSLTAVIPTKVLPDPTESIEVDNSLDDLDDLDDLLVESLALIPKKPTNCRILKETRAKVNDLLALRQQISWDVLENISVWTMTKCSCGNQGELTFVKYMRKLQRTMKKSEKRWDTVENPEERVNVRNALITREVRMCERCCKIGKFDLQGGIGYTNLEKFSEVVK